MIPSRRLTGGQHISARRVTLKSSVGLVALLALAVLVLAVDAAAHRERPTTFPDPSRGRVPEVRTSGPSVVVCKPDSAARIARMPDPARARARALLPRCAYEHIQAAVDAAANGTRILVLPGVYREEPSRSKPYPDPACASLEVPPAAGPGTVPGYEYTLRCPNAQNLIAIVGDTNLDGVCDGKCNVQLEGMGASPKDVLIDGDRSKLNTIRADRAGGIVLRNFTVQFSDFNNIYVIETNGFRPDRIVTRATRGRPGTASTSTTRASTTTSWDRHRLRLPRSPRHAPGLLEVGAQPHLLEQSQPLHPQAARVLPQHAVPTARRSARALPGPAHTGRHRPRHLRGATRISWGGTGSTTTGAGAPRSTGCPRSRATSLTRRRRRTRRTATASSTTVWECDRTRSRRRTGSTSPGTARGRETAGRATAARPAGG